MQLCHIIITKKVPKHSYFYFSWQRYPHHGPFACTSSVCIHLIKFHCPTHLTDQKALDAFMDSLFHLHLLPFRSSQFFLSLVEKAVSALRIYGVQASRSWLLLARPPYPSCRAYPKQPPIHLEFENTQPTSHPSANTKDHAAAFADES
jgi:hypothetical protein